MHANAVCAASDQFRIMYSHCVCPAFVFDILCLAVSFFVQVERVKAAQAEAVSRAAASASGPAAGSAASSAEVRRMLDT